MLGSVTGSGSPGRRAFQGGLEPDPPLLSLSPSGHEIARYLGLLMYSTSRFVLLWDGSWVYSHVDQAQYQVGASLRVRHQYSQIGSYYVYQRSRGIYK